MILILQANLNNINQALNEFERFRHFSGLKANNHKTVVLRTDTLATTGFTLNTLEKLKWTSDSITVLGIGIHPDQTLMVQQNYSPSLQRVRDMITMWRNRDLTPMGKGQVVNSLISSIFSYRFMLTFPPSSTNLF